MGEPASQATRAEARFPTVEPRAGHYESFYLKAAHPDRPLAVWIRYTVHKRPGAAAHGSLWFTLFGRGSGPLASKVTLGPGELAAPEGSYVTIGDSAFGPCRVQGRAQSDRLDASWSLDIDPGPEAYRHLPRGWMYSAPIPRTKLESPHPSARFSGVVTAGERTIDLDGWHGMVGHNWGAQHAERWIWLQGTSFAERGSDTWLDAALGRIKLGPATTPWIANGVLSLDGTRHRLGGIERVRSTKVAETPHGCQFVLPGADLKVAGRVRADPSELVGWVYADPDGSEHNTVNCSIAAMELTVRRKDAPDVRLATDHGATYELGMRERDHGVEIQPFPDG